MPWDGCANLCFVIVTFPRNLHMENYFPGTEFAGEHIIVVSDRLSVHPSVIPLFLFPFHNSKQKRGHKCQCKN